MTTTKADTNEATLNAADPNELADIARKMKMGGMFTPRKVTFAGMAAAAAQDITSAANFALATSSPAQRTGTTRLPPILSVIAVRVTAGAAAAGVRMIGDAGATPSATVAALSDDGKTLTFEGTVTGMVLEYIPRPASGDENTPTDMTANFARS